MKVNIYIETTWHRSPAKKQGVAMWLVEYKLHNGVPVTREGFVNYYGTENQAVLLAIKAAAEILIKTCVITVFTSNSNILNSMKNHWYISWEEKNWCNAKGKPVKNRELWKDMLKILRKHVYIFSDQEHEYRENMQLQLQQKLDTI